MSENLEFIERIKSEKVRSRLSTAQLSEISKVPKSTLDKLLAGETSSPSFSTVRDICIALKISLDYVAGIPSPDHDDPDETALHDEMVKMYERMVTEKTETIRTQSETINHMNQQLHNQFVTSASERDLLRGRYMRIILFLGISLSAVLAVVSVVLLYDLLNPNMGYFRY